MNEGKSRVCPVEGAGCLDLPIRRWWQQPSRIVGPFVKEGMTVLDFGCGPGFFTIDLAHMVGASGRVIAADLQPGMLEKLKLKSNRSGVEERIVSHRCREDRIGITEKIDFALAFYVVHEIPDQESLFRELASVLQPGGQVLVVEPPIHVSHAAFRKTVEAARHAGLMPGDGPKMLFSKSVLLTKILD